VQVEGKLRKDAPVKTGHSQDQGITGVNFIELGGGSADAQTLVAVSGSAGICTKTLIQVLGIGLSARSSRPHLTPPKSAAAQPLRRIC